MKIKTITCHEVYNYGASLQEYALIKYLENLGYKAEAIHYKPKYLNNHFNMFRVSNDRYAKNFILKYIYIFLKLPKRLKSLKRKKQFDKFSKKHIPTATKLYRTNEELKKELPDSDAFICGSDQIWNSFFQNGKDPAFYLDFVPNNKLKLSYAASFAIDKLDENIKDFVKEKVSRLDYISVRESSGVSILENLRITNVRQVLDPVFLLNSKEWIALMDNTIESKNYVLVYDFDSNPLIKKFSKDLKSKYNWDIVSVNENIKYADINYYLEGPDKFLSLIKNAKFVISNSFHAVAFSIIFEKQFVVFNRTDKINTRMRDLLASLDLLDLLILDESILNNYELMAINYNVVKQKLDKKIEFSQNFLNSALK